MLESGHSESEGQLGDKEHPDENAHGIKGEETVHDHKGINPHLFASPRMAAKMAVNVAEGLSGIYPEGAGIFKANSLRYTAELNHLAEEFAALPGRLINNRIVTQHGTFDYLARDAGLEIVAVVNIQGGDSLSAAGIIRLVKRIRQTNAGAVFTEPQYSGRIGRAISVETGIPAGELDPVATGPENAPLNYYELVMRRNMKVLEDLLGVRG